MTSIRRVARSTAEPVMRMLGLVPASAVERITTRATEAVAAVEVKLDLIEGAVSVLDERTRAQMAQASAAAVLAGLRARMDEIERIAACATEELSAIEVKLDIVEGAISVLDSRTRVFTANPLASPSLPRPDAEEPGNGRAQVPEVRLPEEPSRP
jgi:hypothetical protein